MCSRYSLTSPPEAVRALFQLARLDGFPPRYNIAPSQPIVVVRTDAPSNRMAGLMRWGLIPSWVKDPARFKMLINARSETVGDKPSFRAAFRHRRCLVPADGYYEWTTTPSGKQPHLIRSRDGSPFAFAGLWENWLGPDGSEIETAAILTTAANADLSVIHDRMPLILKPADYDAWLDCSPGSGAHVMDLLQPPRAGGLEIVAVTRKLNNSRLEGADLQTPVAADPPLL